MLSVGDFSWMKIREWSQMSVEALGGTFRGSIDWKVLSQSDIFKHGPSTLFACSNLALFLFSSLLADRLQERFSSSFYEECDRNFNLFLINVVWIPIPNVLFNLCAAQFSEDSLSYRQTAAIAAVCLFARHYVQFKQRQKDGKV